MEALEDQELWVSKCNNVQEAGGLPGPQHQKVVWAGEADLGESRHLSA